VGYRFSGHETFPCRYAWLPKAFAAIQEDHAAFADDERAMIRLGVGKNMVRAIRFWMVEMSVAVKRAGGGYEPSSFARAVFQRKKGIDPFLQECDRTCGGHAMRGVGLRNCCWNSSQALEAFRHLRLSIA
jgi:hypothetical protein